LFLTKFLRSILISDSFSLLILSFIIIRIFGVFHPKTLGFYLIFGLFLSALQLFNLGGSWFFYSIIVLFLRGLIVLFLFIARFNNFERVIFEINSFLRIYIFLFFLILIILFLFGRNNFVYIFKVFNISTLFNILSFFRLFLICNLIFLVLTISVKLISLYSAPLKSE